MHMMFVDEPSDPGFTQGASPRFVRAGVIVHGCKWKSVDERIKTFKITRGLDWSDEIRANDIRRGHNAFRDKSQEERQTFLEDLLDTIGRESPELSMIGVCIHKHIVDTSQRERFSNPVVRSVELLLESYDAFLASQKDRCGIVVLDECEAKNDANIRYFQNYLRQFSGNIDARRIVEGTFFLSSRSSNLLQLADVCANVFLRRYRWDEQGIREWAKIENKFDVREWPAQQKTRPRGT
jgi:hypothetical protein